MGPTTVCVITLSWDGILKTIVTSKFILNVLLYNAPTVIRARAECIFSQDSLETGISNVSTVSVLKEKSLMKIYCGNASTARCALLMHNASLFIKYECV